MLLGEYFATFHT